MPLSTTFRKDIQIQKLAAFFVGAATLLAPAVAFAQVENFSDLVSLLVSLLNRVVPGLFALALLLFFWGVAKFILNAGSEDAATEGRTTMFYGIIALFVIFSVWGIVNILENTFFPS